MILKPFGEKAWKFITQDPKLDRKYTLLEGSVRSSKTVAVNTKIITKLCAYKVEGKRVIIGASKQTVYRNILLDIFAIVGKDNYSYNFTSGELWLFGTQWFVIGAKDDAAFTKILGMTVGIAIVDEWTKIPRSFTMQLFLRMSPKGSRLYATTNPDNPFHYLRTDVIDNPAFAPDLDVIHFTLDDNPNIDRAERKRIEASQVGVYYLRYILGLWVVAEGAIYGGAWSEETLYTESSRPLSLYGAGGFDDHLIVVDYGTHNPCVFLDVIDAAGTAWIDREYYWDSARMMRQKTDAEYADDLAKFIADSRIKHRPTVIVDPSAASFKVELSKRGIIVMDANNDVPDGIRLTSTALKLKKIRVRKGDAKETGPVHDGCPNTEREMQSYAWNEKKAKLGEEEPIKANDHTCDAVRYMTNHVFEAPWRLAA
jgi:PBSX family phage terminase large subunit